MRAPVAAFILLLSADVIDADDAVTASTRSPHSLAVDTDAVGAVGVGGMAAGQTGAGVRTGPRYVWTSCDDGVQLRIGPSIGVWGGVAPFGHAAAGGKETWLVISGSVEATWLVRDGIRLGPELTATAPSLWSEDSRYPSKAAFSVGLRVRYDVLSAGLAVEHAWAPTPSQYVQTTSSSDSFVATAGVTGRPGIYAGAALVLFAVFDVVVGSIARD